MRLKSYLKQKHGMQKEMANTLGIPSSTLKSYADGTRQAGIVIATRIQDYTGGEVTIADLFEAYRETQGARQ